MKKILVAATLAVAFVALPASAQLYAGAGVGSAKNDGREDSWKLYAGYQFNPTWGVEAAYTDLGKYRGADVESWSVAGTGTMPLNERWALIGKLGASANRPDAAGTSDHTDVLVGLGVGYSFTRNVGMRLEYEDFGKLTDAGGGDSRGRNVTLSLKYSF